MPVGEKVYEHKETFPTLYDWLIMKELPMKKSDNSLLPLRGKISPPTILNCENHAVEQRECSKETINTVGGRERLFSASSRSATSSKHESTLSERCLTPPFTPSVNGEHGLLSRRPSEHFLEVLEEQNERQTLPKVFSASCLPPLRKTNQGENSSKRTFRGAKIAFSANINGEGAFSRQVEPNENRPLLLVSGARRELTAPNYVNKPILRKTHSLPLIKTCSALTTGIGCINVSGVQNRITSAVVSQEQTSPVEFVDRPHNLPIADEYIEELCNEDEELDQDDEEETSLEKFAMICHWLKDCEKAKVT